LVVPTETRKVAIVSETDGVQGDYEVAYRTRSPLFGVNPSAALAKAIDALQLSGHALDIGCGDGREALYLVERGFDVDAFDASEEAIKALLRRAEHENIDRSHINAFVADVRDFRAEKRYDLIVATTVLDHLSDEELDVVERVVVNWLKPGGVLYVEVYTSADPALSGSGLVSEFEAEIRHFFAPNELLERFSRSLVVSLYEEMPEWDHDHGPAHQHFFARLCGTRRSQENEEGGVVGQVIPELAVSDMAASIDFYRTVVGFEVLDRVDIEGEAVWAELGFGEGRLMLQRVEDVVDEIPVLRDRAIGGTGLVVVRFDDAEPVEAVAIRAVAGEWEILSGPAATDYGTMDLGLLDPDSYVVLCSGQITTGQASP